MKKKLTVTIDEDVLERLKERAKEDSLNVSKLMNNLINKYLSNYDEEIIVALLDKINVPDNIPIVLGSKEPPKEGISSTELVHVKYGKYTISVPKN